MIIDVICLIEILEGLGVLVKKIRNKEDLKEKFTKIFEMDFKKEFETDDNLEDIIEDKQEEKEYMFHQITNVIGFEYVLRRRKKK